MRKNVPNFCASAVAIAVALALPTEVTAQAAPSSTQLPGKDASAPPAADSSQASPTTNEGGLEEIMVTAQRRSENLQSVPIAVSVLSADRLATMGVSDTKLLATAVPGLTFTTQANLAAPRIRGIGAASAGAGNENPVSLYVDGVYYASAGASVLSFNNISQIAVLKGPQGTLFGRNATGGLIQITTRDPSPIFSGMADASYGNHNTVGADLYTTGPLAEGLAADLAVHFLDQADGFGTNLYNGLDVNKSRDIAVRSKIQAKPNGLTSATLTLDYSLSHSSTPAYRVIDGELPLDGKLFTDGKFDVNTNIQPLTRVEQYGAALNLFRDLDIAQLISISAYRVSTFHAIFDADGQPEDFISGDVKEPGRQFSQELQLLSPGGGKFNWQAGLYYFWARDGFLPTTVPLPLFGISSHINTKQRTQSYAGYAQGTYRFDERTSLTLGARLTHETKYIDGSGAIEVLGANLSIPSGPYSSSTSVTKPTWRVALDHQLTDDVLVYVSYNRGFKSGGYDPSSTDAPISFRPEVLDAYEVGLKSELFDHKVRLNAATFYYDYRDIQLNSYHNGVTSIYNGKSAKIYGLDLDLTAAVTSSLTLTGGLSLLHDQLGDFPITQTAVLPAGGLVALPDMSAEGKHLQNTPDWQLNAGIEYRVPLKAGSVLLATDYFHSARWYSTPENRLSQPAYDLFNASATWLIDSGERYSVQLWGKNLGNKAYAQQLTVEVPVADFVTMAEGRTFGAKVGMKF
jgi:iron complex outermembrane receptor protein